MIKNPPANAGDKRYGLYPWVGEIPWRRAWQPTPIFLLGESHGERSLAGYSPWGHKVSDTIGVYKVRILEFSSFLLVCYSFISEASISKVIVP